MEQRGSSSSSSCAVMLELWTGWSFVVAWLPDTGVVGAVCGRGCVSVVRADREVRTKNGYSSTTSFTKHYLSDCDDNGGGGGDGDL